MTIAEAFLRGYDKDPRTLGEIAPGIESITRVYHLRDVTLPNYVGPFVWLMQQSEGVYLIWLSARRNDTTTVEHVVVVDCVNRHIIDCASRYKLRLCEEAFNICTGDDAGEAYVRNMKVMVRQEEGRGGPGKVRRTHRRRSEKRKQIRLK